MNYQHRQREYLGRLSRELPLTSFPCEPGNADNLGRLVSVTLQGAWMRNLVNREFSDYHYFQRQARINRLPEVEPSPDAIDEMYSRRDSIKARKGHLTMYDLLETLYLRYREELASIESAARREPHNDGRGTTETQLLVNGTEVRGSVRWRATPRKVRNRLTRRDGSPFVTACKVSLDGGATWSEMPMPERKERKQRKQRDVSAADQHAARLRQIAGTIRMADQD